MLVTHGGGEFQPYLDIDDELRTYYHDTHALLASILTRYVADGAAVPSSLAVNSSLTILANAERIAAGIVERYRDVSEVLRTAAG